MELQARWGLCTVHFFRGEYATGLKHSKVLSTVAMRSADPAAHSLSHRMTAIGSFFCGAFLQAKQHAEAALRIAGGNRRGRDNMFQMDARIAPRSVLCRTLWMLGDSKAAMATAIETVADAQQSGHALSLCYALFGVSPVAIWSGEFDVARRWTNLLLEEARRKGIDYWREWAECYSLGLELASLQEQSTSFHDCGRFLLNMDAPRKEMLLTFCADLVDDTVIARAQRGENFWCEAEVWRAQGSLHDRRGAIGESEANYRRSLEIARAQGAVGWEMRASLSLAQMWSRNGHVERAFNLLQIACERCGTGCGSKVIGQARELLSQLQCR